MSQTADEGENDFPAGHFTFGRSSSEPPPDFHANVHGDPVKRSHPPKDPMLAPSLRRVRGLPSLGYVPAPSRPGFSVIDITRTISLYSVSMSWPLMSRSMGGIR